MQPSKTTISRAQSAPAKRVQFYKFPRRIRLPPSYRTRTVLSGLGGWSGFTREQSLGLEVTAQGLFGCLGRRFCGLL